MSTSSKALAVKLADLAGGQKGFFSARQAVDIGYADSVHGYHVRNGDWIKVHRGIYRLSEAAYFDWPELVIWSLWSCGRGENSESGVYCRETALAIHGHLANKPPFLHMAVNPKFRRNTEPPPQLLIYKEDLPADDVEDRGGYRVTSLARTLADLEKTENPDILGIMQGIDVNQGASVVTAGLCDAYEEKGDWAKFREQVRERNEDFRVALEAGED